MELMKNLNKAFPGIASYLLKQAPPGAPPRPGLEWNPQSHRWVRSIQEIMGIKQILRNDELPLSVGKRLQGKTDDMLDRMRKLANEHEEEGSVNMARRMKAKIEFIENRSGDLDHSLEGKRLEALKDLSEHRDWLEQIET